MLEIHKLEIIRQVKNLNPLTESISLSKYMQEVREKIAQCEGISEEKVTDEQIFKYVTNA